MKLAIRLIIVLLIGLPIGLMAAPEQPLSLYTQQLLELLNLFKKLDEATAARMAENERYLMAKSMLRLSGAFYQLRNDKNRFEYGIRWGIANGQHIHPDMYGYVSMLQYTLSCLSAQLNEKGARIGALVGFDGPAVEKTLAKGLELKSRSLDDLIAKLGLDPETPNLDQLILADAAAAEEAADALYKKTAEFAHVLDPSVVPPEHPPRCVFPNDNP
jgi:hypothetical protein